MCGTSMSSETTEKDTGDSHVQQLSTDVSSKQKIKGIMDNLKYDMNHERRGLFVIFNHTKFPVGEDRYGTAADEKNLKGAMEHLGFEVKVHRDLKAEEILGKIKKYAGRDYSNCDCFGCAVLTHGCNNDMIWARDETYCLSQIMNPFRHSESLHGKPKIFIFEACRGEEKDTGAVKKFKPNAVKFVEDEGTLTIPLESNFVIAYATPAGYCSWSHEDTGSVFIQKLADCIIDVGRDCELMQILTIVNNQVSHVEVPQKNGNVFKQIPSIVSRLTRFVYFTAKIGQSPPAVHSVTQSKIATSSVVSEDRYYDRSTLNQRIDQRVKSEVERLMKERENQ